MGRGTHGSGVPAGRRSVGDWWQLCKAALLVGWSVACQLLRSIRPVLASVACEVNE